MGVVDVDTFCPEGKRNEIAMKLNNLLASPGFSAWLEGEPLNIQRMFYTADGKPRVTIFCIAHLSDTERMFFVSLLLNQLLGWMRSQQGTTSLRAIFYMDEIYGYLPPTAMPPSKKPMMILLKQARAFGLGLLLATQNPVDLDYKALSNIGTWWLGRLQTERDKARVLDGLEGAASTQGGEFDRGKMEQLLAALGNRVFLMNNVHEDGPAVFHVRWILSYLSGPLSRPQIKALMDPVRKKQKARAAEDADSGFLPPQRETAVRNTTKPKLPEGVEEFFMAPKTAVPADRLCYVPALIRSATVNYDDAKRKISGRSSPQSLASLGNRQQEVKSSLLDIHPHGVIRCILWRASPNPSPALISKPPRQTTSVPTADSSPLMLLLVSLAFGRSCAQSLCLILVGTKGAASAPKSSLPRSSSLFAAAALAWPMPSAWARTKPSATFWA